jgi:hypothetical protein
MLNINTGDNVTQKEIVEHEWEVENFEKQAAHQLQMKELDIQASKLEARITSWFSLPRYLLSIPVRILFVIPLCLYVLKRQEIPAEFWKLLK